LQIKGKYRNCGNVGHKAVQCKSKHGRDEKNDVVCNYCKRPGHVKANCFKLMKKNLDERSSSGTENGAASTADVVLSSMMKIKNLGNGI
jgi:C2H2 zinc-finger/Zinc knuckle